MAKNISGSSLYHIPTTFLPQCLVYGIGFGVSKSNHTSTSHSQMGNYCQGQAGCLSVSQCSASGMEGLCRNPRESRGSMWIQLLWQLSLPPPPGDLPLSAALELVCPGGLRAGTRTSYIFGRVSPPPRPPRCLGSLVPRLSHGFGLAQWGSCSSWSSGLALWTGSLGSDNFLVKSTCYFLSRVPVPSWAIPDLPFQFISFPFPHVESTYRSVKVWEGFETTDVPPQCTEHVLSRTCRLVVLPIVGSRVTHRGAHFYSLNLKRAGQES